MTWLVSVRIRNGLIWTPARRNLRRGTGACNRCGLALGLVVSWGCSKKWLWCGARSGRRSPWQGREHGGSGRDRGAGEERLGKAAVVPMPVPMKEQAGRQAGQARLEAFGAVAGADVGADAGCWLLVGVV